jgi:hypothetical protein
MAAHCPTEAMATNDYEFMTRWRVLGKVAEVYDLVVDVQGYLRWWPQVYLGVTRNWS